MTIDRSAEYLASLVRKLSKLSVMIDGQLINPSVLEGLRSELSQFTRRFVRRFNRKWKSTRYARGDVDWLCRSRMGLAEGRYGARC